MASSVLSRSQRIEQPGGPEWERWRRAKEERAAVSARVIAAWPGYLELDLGVQVRARARRGDLLPRPGSLRDMDRYVGAELQGLVTVVEPERRGVVVSPRHLAVLRFDEAFRQGRKVSGRVVDANDGGIMVEVEGARGFVPKSHLAPEDARAHVALVGREWSGYVIRATARKFILSARPPSEATPKSDHEQNVSKLSQARARLSANLNKIV